jgi:uncharacterized protein
MQNLKPFSLLIKPASADCNLRCAYCFYLSRYALYPYSKKHRMSQETLELTIRSYLETEQPNYVFCWQGGEPTLMGVDFFRKVVDVQRKHSRKGSLIVNTLQTNATLINDTFARHFSRYNFLVGVSLDGPSYIHDHHRTYKSGRGSYFDVIRGLECLKRNHVEFNILTLVSDINIEKSGEVYRYLRDMGFFYHQYIPCVEVDRNSRPFPFTISGEAWGNFLCELYDEWSKRDVHTVSVRLFDSIIAYLLHGVHDNCQMGTNCSQYYVVEYNGDIYPCDFFVDSELKLNTIRKKSWKQVAQSKRYLHFGEQKSHWHAQCKICEYLEYCGGDCLKHRPCGKINPRHLSLLCSGWKQFFKHTLPGFEKLAERIRAERLHTPLARF